MQITIEMVAMQKTVNAAPTGLTMPTRSPIPN
jgi:hypothetical protein